MNEKRVSEMTDAEIREMAGAGDGVTAYLDEVRLRSRKVGANGGPPPGSANRRHRANEQSARDVPRLVAAIDAVLALTRDPEGDLPGECEVSVGALREAISRALLEVRMIV